jgi:hypothetical protein
LTGLFVGLCVFLPTAQAVLFSSTGDPGYNTTAPSGSLTASGWQWEGAFGSYLGTAISSEYFITAKHIGGTVGSSFSLNGSNYTTTAVYTDPGADLAIWRISGSFSTWAPLDTNTNDVGKHTVVFGRGTQRGNPVIVSGRTNGWHWGAADGVQRWGENDVSATLNAGAGLGLLLACAFDRNANSNECQLSVGDSGGGMFIQDGSTWKLAGIHFGVDGFFSTDGTANTQFDAALLDAGGLWVGGGTNWTFVPDGTADVPSSFYSTSISANMNWISSVIPEPAPILLVGAGTLALLSFVRKRR